MSALPLLGIPTAAADLVLLDTNPLDNVSHVRRLPRVMLAGRWLDAARLPSIREQVANAVT